MKKINIIYWVSTILIVLLMLWSAIGSFMKNSDAAKMMAQMGYQAYVFHFLAVAKVLGVIAILVPGYPRLKEWAYAGFTFDLLGATYSLYATNFPVSNWAPMFIFLAILAVSYIYYHKRQTTTGVKDATV
ncbi:DoxX family protein [Mucilaginibacter sp.]|uniref:DoxX family protein n=1 Tax=Mucilaginibacter sp. TaxID=1882438 RepID=UPI002848B910|nr:DoxX family protein [Mucilaginibacter sp.]MDR3694936.1 DoxX family protein [Mucilaginibacter sp.]